MTTIEQAPWRPKLMAGYPGPPTFESVSAIGLEIKDGFGLGLTGGGLIIEDVPIKGTWTIQCQGFKNELTTVTRDESGTHVHSDIPASPAGDQHIVRKGDTQTVSFVNGPNKPYWDEVISYQDGEVTRVDWPKKNNPNGPTFETVSSANGGNAVVMTNWPTERPADPNQALNWPISVSRLHYDPQNLGDRIAVVGAPPHIPKATDFSSPWCAIFKPVAEGISVETGLGDSSIHYTADGFVLTDSVGLKWEVKKTA